MSRVERVRPRHYLIALLVTFAWYVATQLLRLIESSPIRITPVIRIPSTTRIPFTIRIPSASRSPA